MRHRTGQFSDWGSFVGWLGQSEADGWHLIGFQIVLKDARNVALGMTVYAVLGRGKAE